MTTRLAAFAGWPGLLERLIGREGFLGDEPAQPLAALLRSLGLEMMTVVFEQPPAT
jgi:hypothetical protein